MMLVEAAFREYGKLMLGAVIRFCGDEQAAEDGVSQAFVQALARREMLEAMPEPAMRAWLYAAARNAVVDSKRRSIRLRRLPDGDESLFADTRLPDPAGKLTAEALLERLPHDLGAVVRMKYYGGMNSGEIGSALGIPPATVRTRLRKALGMMRDRGKGPGI
jgi:RNA polymerase sigma-70 factor (ECF subfamily)